MSQTTSTSPLIELRDVRVVYTSRTGSLLKPVKIHAVDGVSLQVLPGRTLGIVGESGSGKTTTARVLLGLEQATSGEVYFKGRRMGRRSARQRKEIGRVVSAVFQDPATALNPRMVIRDALRDPLDVHGIGSPAQRKEKVRELIQLVGLPTSALDMLPTQLSGGQRQRVAIARSIAARPDLIVADEPISALDASSQAGVAAMMRRLCLDAGAGMLFISHDLSVVRQIADRTAVMYRGRIVESGATEVVWNDPVHPYTRALLAAIPRADGKGNLPQAPAAEAPAEWASEVPEALERV